MTSREIFIETTKSLFTNDVRRITTDPFKVGEGYEFAIPLNDLILIDGHCGAKTILEHENTTKYVIISANKFVFNNIQYATIYVIVESPTQTAEIYSALSNSETLALRCSKSDHPLLPIGGDVNFIDSPSSFRLTRYMKTTQEGIYIRQDLTLDITEKLNVSIQDSQLIVTPKTQQPSP